VKWYSTTYAIQMRQDMLPHPEASLYLCANRGFVLPCLGCLGVTVGWRYSHWRRARRNKYDLERRPVPSTLKRPQPRFCGQCGVFLAKDDRFCSHCGGQVHWDPDSRCGGQVHSDPDNSFVIYMKVPSDGIKSVTWHLERARPQAAPERASNSVGAHARWSKSRKVWAFTVGLATVVGAVTAVLTLVVH
jgi:hypothetical protein